MNKRIGIFLVVVVVLFLTPDGDSNGVDSELWGKIFDVGHTIIFASLSALVLFELRRKSRRDRIVATASVILLVPLIELIQPYCQRDGSWIDVQNGLLGCMLGILGIWLFERKGSALSWGCYAGTCCAAFAYGLLPAAEEFAAMQYRTQMFPLLADFENDYEALLWDSINEHDKPTAELEISNSFATTGEYSLHVTTRPQTWSGVGYEAGYLDWSNYSAFVFAVNNTGEPFELNVRIDDDGNVKEFENRYNESFAIKHGVQQIQIPIKNIVDQVSGRAFNLHAIRRVLFFAGEKETSGREFYLDDLRLER